MYHELTHVRWTDPSSSIELSPFRRRSVGVVCGHGAHLFLLSSTNSSHICNILHMHMQGRIILCTYLL